MGIHNVIALSTELAVLGWYISNPLSHDAATLIQTDLDTIWDFRQSLASSALLSLVRLVFFVYIRHSSKRAPVTRCFVFLVFLTEGAICALGSLQPMVYWRDSRSFQRYRALSWGSTFVNTLWSLALVSTLLQLVYILRLNKSSGRLVDDRLMDDVLNESTNELAEAKLAHWRHKWTQLVKHIKRRQTDPTFEAIVRLYAQRSGAVERLAVVYDRNPNEFEFYLPQLCSFLLLGAFVQSPQLCIILLDKCSVSHVFAHRILWYFQSYCLKNPAFASEESSSRIQMLIDEVSARGVEPARTIECPPFQSNEEARIDRSVADAGAPHEAALLLPTREEQYNTFHGHMIDMERGVVSSNPFAVESTFLNALATISSNLRSIAISQRNEVLRNWLSDLQGQYLPSNSLYLPVGNAHHRLKRIHVTESFTFSTRERVPYLLCAEVIDYASPDDKKVSRKRSSLFNARRFTLNLWDKSAHSVVNHSAVSSSERQPLVSPDSAALGFWSESKPPSSPPRLRSISQHLSTSIGQPGDLLNGIIDTLVRKTPGPKQPHSSGSTDMKGSNREALLAEGESTERAPLSPTSPSRFEVDRSMRQSGATENSKYSLTIDTSSAEKSHTAHLRDDMWSPRSDGPMSPHSPSSAYSPPSLARCDSTDIFLRTLSERDLKFAEEDDHLLAPLSIGRPEAPCVIFRERWSDKEARIRVTSPWGQDAGWRLLPVIVKSDDDLRQEQLASQLIKQFSKVFEEAKLPVFIRPYDVIAISPSSGLVEAIADTISIDSLKRNDREYTTLLDFFRRHFGDESTSEFRAARNNFVSSMAAYSIVCYLLQIKDRHNGNILLDAEGHIIHIDFGFMLANNPGNVAFEQAPFKLTNEFVELMGGPRSASFRRFRSLCVRSFLVARKYRHRFILLVEMMLNGNGHLPCFAGDPRGTIDRLAARFQPEMDINACEDFVHDLIDASLDNWRTKWYDKYQRWIVGVF